MLVLRDHVQFVAQALADSKARGPLLDIGCGGGLFLGMMRERGFRVIGLDNSREAAGIAWRRQQVPAIVADLERAPLRAGSLAGLSMFHVMEHLYDPRAYLRVARGVLAADGRLVVQVPNAASWQARLLGSAWNGADVPRHLFDFRDRDLEKMMEGAGFEVLRRKYFSLRDNPAGLASSLAPSLDPMARRVRRVRESDGARLAKDLTYFGSGGRVDSLCGGGGGFRRGLDGDDRGAAAMSYTGIAYRLPRVLRRHVLNFEVEIEEAVAKFARDLPEGARLLDAGAGEGQYRGRFARQRYCGVDLAVGDAAWDYGKLDAIADLTSLPFRAGAFDAAIHIVTIEHLREPAAALAEMARTLAPGGLLLIAAPHEWEVHQAPHDYFRYTRYGLAYLLEKAGFEVREMRAAGGYFRLLARRLLNGLQFFTGGVRWLLFVPAAILLVPPALILPLLDPLDRDRNFTLGYVCIARRVREGVNDAGRKRIPLDGVIVIDKPEGWTSHDVVNKVRRIAQTKKVGHLGTLDPIATGVLPMVIERATRLAQFYTRSDKIYEGLVRFGVVDGELRSRGREPTSEKVEVRLTAEELQPKRWRNSAVSSRSARPRYRRRRWRGGGRTSWRARTSRWSWSR